MFIILDAPPSGEGKVVKRLRLWPVSACFAAALLSLPPASPVPIDGELQVSGSIQAKGEALASLEAGALGYQSIAVQGYETTIVVEEALVRIVSYPYLVYEESPSAPGAPKRVAQELPMEELTNFTFTGTLRAASDLNSTLLTFPTERGFRVAFSSRGFEAWPGELGPEGTAGKGKFYPLFEGRQMWPDPAWGRLSFIDGNATMPPQPGIVYAYGPRLGLSGTQDRNFDTGPKTTVEQAGPGSWAYVRRIDQVFAVIQSHSVAIDWQPAREWNLYAKQAQGALAGDIAWTGADTTAHINGTKFDQETGLLQAIGNFTWAAKWEGQSHWTFHGEASFVAANAKAIVGSRAPMDALAAAGATLSLLALFAYLLKDRLVTALACLNRAEPLAHPQRVRILELAAANPGVSVEMLAERLGQSRAAIRFHVAVLERNKLVQSTVRFGARRLFAAGSEGLAIGNHPVRARILEQLAEGPRSLPEVRANWGEGAPSVQLLHYHARELLKYGIIVEGPRGRSFQLALPTVDRSKLVNSSGNQMKVSA